MKYNLQALCKLTIFIFKFIRKCRIIIDNARTIFEPIIQTRALEDLEESNGLLEGTNMMSA